MNNRMLTRQNFQVIKWIAWSYNCKNIHNISHNERNHASIAQTGLHGSRQATMCAKCGKKHSFEVDHWITSPQVGLSLDLARGRRQSRHNQSSHHQCGIWLQVRCWWLVHPGCDGQVSEMVTSWLTGLYKATQVVMVLTYHGTFG